MGHNHKPLDVSLESAQGSATSLRQEVRRLRRVVAEPS